VPLALLALQDAPARLPDVELRPVVVEGRADLLVGRADSASEGVVGPAQLERRPLLRPGEVLETVPGLITTQHSGAGKANQFFLRGFNLDHGTDLATTVGGVPVNLPTHGHGQGYTDLGFLIPELVGAVWFRKGPYFADVGDFGSAGAVELDWIESLPRAVATMEVGSFGWQRGLFADSFGLEGGTLLAAAEAIHHDGPWSVAENYDRQNSLLRLTRGDSSRRESWTLQASRAEWTATDQIARRAEESGLVGRFGSLDQSDGGDSERVSLAWHREDLRGEQQSRLTAWAAWSKLELFSNFTYFLDDPLNGDQFRQLDRRAFAGVDARRTFCGSTFGREREVTVGMQLRTDSIDNALDRTSERAVLSTVRADEVWQSSGGLFGEWRQGLTDWMRATAGVRADGIVSPRLSLAFGPFAGSELYLSGGFGFHSNDGRGALTDDDSATPTPLDGRRVDPLVQTRGAEIGVRTVAIDGLQSTLSVWLLDSDSELLFIGNAGNTEASRPSRRYGVEWANWWEPRDWLALDLDASLSRAAFTDDLPVGDRIPGALTGVIATGVTLKDDAAQRYVTLRWRWFGPRRSPTSISTPPSRSPCGWGSRRVSDSPQTGDRTAAAARLGAAGSAAVSRGSSRAATGLPSPDVTAAAPPPPRRRDGALAGRGGGDGGEAAERSACGGRPADADRAGRLLRSAVERGRAARPAAAVAGRGGSNCGRSAGR